jgi:purine-nucleoside/S-methyl-5'-thioadenosine phosphorylase / adenosine deaminase
MQEWVGGAHAFVPIAELEACDENRKITHLEKPKPMDSSLYTQSGLLSRAGFSHGFFTRRGGVSSGAYASLNLSMVVGDSAENVSENRRRVATALRINADKIYVPHQVHDRGVRLIDGTEPPSVVETWAADALVSDACGVACAVRTADCVPILIGDRETRRVAAIHAGWRGVVKGVTGAAIDLLVAHGSHPQHLIAAIGPHISLAAFEVGDEVARELEAVSAAPGAVVTRAGEKPHVDLCAILREQLLARGVSPAHIERIPGCTVGDAERFFSYRRDGARSGRQLSAIVADAPGACHTSEHVRGGGVP